MTNEAHLYCLYTNAHITEILQHLIEDLNVNVILHETNCNATGTISYFIYIFISSRLLEKKIFFNFKLKIYAFNRKFLENGL